jgi:hypothetical protein
MKKLFSIIVKMARAVFGGIGIIMVVVGLIGLALGILTIITEKENPKLVEMAYQEVATGAIILLVGFPLFGLCAGALKRPLYLLAPIILIISFVLAGILLPESMQGVKGQGAGLGALAITILAFRFINRHYSKREEAVSKQETGQKGGRPLGLTIDD